MLRQAFWASVDGKLAEMGDESREKNHRNLLLSRLHGSIQYGAG